ncbi:Mbeg1-like protein [Streptococcus marimammalium]|uniref:Mbeg1-like protein n=1 Tax=Streptococcus marimammalium TaxID=269666 RepID=UPI0003808F2B|nr:Mbeg1-like protein [Streptococcus marimammalium]
MSNFIDYIQKNYHCSFKELPLNEVDIACINELSYLPIGEALSKTYNKQFIPIKQLNKKKHLFFKKTNYNFMTTKERVQLYEAIINSNRFDDLEIGYYVNDINLAIEKQFSAMVFRLPSINHTQIVFRGTDDSLIGWKEDAKMTYMKTIPSHQSALNYLTTFLNDWQGQVVISGHSKGGNLALYASSMIKESLQKKITTIYTFDSPGHYKSLLDASSYPNIKHKIISIIPKESIVGVMLKPDLDCKIVESKSFAFFQHNVSQWQVKENQFLPAKDTTLISKALEDTFKLWQKELSHDELETFFNIFFDLFFDIGVESLDDIKNNKRKTLTQLVKEIVNLKPKEKKIMRKSLRTMFIIFNHKAIEKALDYRPEIGKEFLDWIFSDKEE